MLKPNFIWCTCKPLILISGLSVHDDSENPKLFFISCTDADGIGTYGFYETCHEFIS